MRLFVLSVCALAAGASQVLATGQFTTVNGQVYDPNGALFVARGINIPGQNFWTNHDPTADVSKIADAWNFNLVRVNSQVLSDWRAPGYNINLDNIINAFTSRGIVVEIDTQESTGKYFEGDTLAQAANWYGSLAAQYKNNPYVWFNTGNEPGNMVKPTDPAQLATWDQWTPDGAKWLTMNQTIISAIRNAGNNNMVVVDGTNYGQDQAWDDRGTLNPKHSAILTYGPTLAQEYSNVMFDTHLYGEWSSSGAVPTRLAAYVQAVQAAGLPLMFGEYDAIDGGATYAQVQGLLAIANQYDIGRVAWHWVDAGDNSDLTTSTDPTALGTTWQTGGGYLINSDTNPTNLTPFGQLVWNDNHQLAFVPEPTLGLTAMAGILALTPRRRPLR